MTEVMRMEDYPRFGVSPKSPKFWGVFPKHEDNKEAKVGAKAIRKCFKGLPLHESRITREELHNFYNQMREVASEWEHLGLCDSEMREAFFVLVGRFYGLPYSSVHNLYYGFSEGEKGLLIAIGSVDAPE